MTTQQLILGLVLAMMVFSVALHLRLDDFRRLGRHPWPVLCGLLSQFVLLPGGTWLATLALNLPPNIEVAMILVAVCPGTGASNVVTHFARGNTALSVSLTAATSVLSVVTMPLYASTMLAANPATAAWLQALHIDTSGMWLQLLLILALPLGLGLACAHRLPGLTARIHQPLGRLAVAALVLFIAVSLIRERHLLSLGVLPIFLIVVLHNASGLLMGWLSSHLLRMTEPDRRAITLEAGMQSSGIALGIIALQFGSDPAMVALAGLWGVWHQISALALAWHWRRQDAHAGHAAISVPR